MLSSRASIGREAALIGDRLANDAVWFRDRCAWLQARREPGPHGGPLMRRIDASIHSGTAGIALFLARLSKETGSDAHRKAAEGALRHALEHAWFVDAKDGPLNVRSGAQWRFGFYFGTLGIAWAAHELGEAFDKPEYALASRRLIRQLATTLQDPFELDLYFGAASGAPALLDLAGRGVPEARELALRMGDAILAGAHVDGKRHSWGKHGTDGASKDLTGFSHGASGFALALARLYGATNDERYRKAARGAIAYERDAFDAQRANWADFQQAPEADGRPRTRSTFCHGAPGIGVARAAMYADLPDPAIREDLAAARRATAERVETTLGFPGDPFTLCCGATGVAECGWIIADALGDPTGYADARRVADAGIAWYGSEARRDGPDWIDYPTGVSKGYYPSLLQGISGVGHFLLRISAPEKVPTLLVPGRAPLARAAQELIA